MKKIKLSEIIIPNVFLQSNPSKTKMERCRNKWRKYNKQPKPLIVDKDKVLVDGYIQYLILKELGNEEGNYLVRHESKKKRRVLIEILRLHMCMVCIRIVIAQRNLFGEYLNQ